MLEHLLGDLSRIGQLGRHAEVLQGIDYGFLLGGQANGLRPISVLLREGPSLGTDDDTLMEKTQAGPCQIRDVQGQDRSDVGATE